MYIVTRTFRDANGVFGVGSIVDPTSVKTFRSRLQQRHIVDVDERNLDEWVRYFKNRHGIDLSTVLTEYLDAQPEVEEPVVTGDGFSYVQNILFAEAEKTKQASSEEDESW